MEDNEIQKEIHETHFEKYIFRYFFGVITLILLFGIIPPFNNYGSLDSELFARYGDFIGGLFGSLLTGATILLLIYYNNKQLDLLDKQQKKFEEVSNEQIKLLKLEIEENKTNNRNNLNLLEEELNNNTYFYIEERLEKSLIKLTDFRKKNIIINFQCFHQQSNNYEEKKINCNTFTDLLNFLNDFYEKYEQNLESNFELEIIKNYYNYYMNIIVEIMHLSDICNNTNKFSKYYNIYNQIEMEFLNRDRFNILYYYVLYYKYKENKDLIKINEHFNNLSRFGLYKYFDDLKTKHHFEYINKFLIDELKKYSIDIKLYL